MSPALTTTATTSTSQARASKTNGNSKPAQPRPRKATTRARARVRRGALGSDDEDEIERQAHSDDSSVTDESERDSEDDDDDDDDDDVDSVLSAGRSHPDTPSTTQSPPPDEVEAAAADVLDDNDNFGEKPKSNLAEAGSGPTFLAPATDWSEMMLASEGVAVNGADGALPVIEFAELHVHAPGEAEDGQLAADLAPQLQPDSETTPTAPEQDGVDTTDHARQGAVRGRGHGPRGPRGRGRGAQEAYQQRLRDDASFVPRIGEFWGHDDRLLDKDLRSMSSWWRGRWTRGRGGPVGRGRGSGRGGHFQGPGHVNGAVEGEADAADDSTQQQPERPPVERQWTHDGFEEMKAREDRRRAQERQEAGSGSGSGSGAHTPSSRGGFVHRGRGNGTFAARRGAFSPTSPRGYGRGRGMPFVLHAHVRARSSAEGDSERTWFAMKPERIWTKQFEGFLYQEHALKAKPGRGVGYRVHIPGKGVDIIRSPVSAPGEKGDEGLVAMERASSETPTATDGSGKRVIVKIPKLAEKPVVQEAEPESFTTVDQLSVTGTEFVVNVAVREEVRTNGVALPVEQVQPIEEQLEAPARPSSPPQERVHPQDVIATPGLTRNDSLSDNSIIGTMPDVVAQPAPVVLTNPKDSPINVLPPVQPVYSPSQPSPTYNAPYGYPPNIPPGMAYQMPGAPHAHPHPIFLHATPPPPMQVYAPHAHAVPFVPGHMHHHSHSHSMSGAEYMHVPPGTPPLSLNGFVDPTTGQPIFVLPRQSSRIEIRAPGEGGIMGSDGATKRPSNLRSSTVPDVRNDQEEGGIASPQQTQSQPQPVNGGPAQAPQPVRYASAPEFYPRSVSYDGRPLGHAYQTSEGSVASGHDDPAVVNGYAPPPMQDPAMMGYAGYAQGYYYPEAYYAAYAPPPPPPQQPGQYDPYAAAGDPHQQVPIYY